MSTVLVVCDSAIIKSISLMTSEQHGHIRMLRTRSRENRAQREHFTKLWAINGFCKSSICMESRNTLRFMSRDLYANANYCISCHAPKPKSFLYCDCCNTHLRTRGRSSKNKVRKYIE